MEIQSAKLGGPTCHAHVFLPVSPLFISSRADRKRRGVALSRAAGRSSDGGVQGWWGKRRRPGRGGEAVAATTAASRSGWGSGGDGGV
ncbi:hypothetical protein [Oryza sativa Japonica Group]|uniref:Uncharacterized protein n=2 Tax=Oryza sativa subsp. japonica TaxID=39947 RepID=Q5N9A4_ORYSJ|nr:hypothetical protein [Oryza sativa Japonica Group]BAD82455.1 hypothetical protein [Oryza sativa Japonica Group]